MPRGWVAVSGGLGVCAVGAGLGWVVFASSLLAVDQVDVAGERRLPTARIAGAAQVRTGIPLARVDVDAVRERVEALRVVESAEVRRGWPSTVRITVRERVPVAAVPREGGFVLLDDDGVRVATATDAPRGLPVVRIDSGADAAEDSRAQTAANRTALRVLGVLPSRLAARVSTVTVATDGGVRLRFRDGATVIWGNAEHGQKKARILAALLRRREAKTYDVSSVEVVTTGNALSR